MAAPLQDIQDIVATMLILLGSNRKDCSSWKAMRSAIGKTGKESLRRKIMTFDITNVTQEMADRAHLLMAKVELDRAVEVREVGAVAGVVGRNDILMLDDDVRLWIIDFFCMYRVSFVLGEPDGRDLLRLQSWHVVDDGGKRRRIENTRARSKN